MLSSVISIALATHIFFRIIVIILISSPTLGPNIVITLLY